MFSNWKTSLLGLLGGLASIFAAQVQTGHISAPAYISAAVIALLGLVAKDFNVTGGTVTQ